MGRPGLHWSGREVEVLVTQYMALLLAEMRGRKPAKGEALRRLEHELRERTRGSIEFKMGNVSAILAEDGLPWLDGFKPAPNYQAALRHEVESRLGESGRLRTELEEAQRAVREPAGSSVRTSDVAMPPPAQRPHTRLAQHSGSLTPAWRGAIVDAANRRLGRAGEEWVCQLERAELKAVGRTDLAAKVEAVSQTRGDGLGYDVLSFAQDGTERWIEVKTTNSGRSAPFLLTPRELEVWRRNPGRYWLFRVYSFAGDARLYQLCGEPERLIALTTAVWQARPV